MVHSLEVYLGKGLGEVGSNGDASKVPMADTTRYSREDHLSERCRSLLWTLQVRKPSAHLHTRSLQRYELKCDGVVGVCRRGR